MRQKEKRKREVADIINATKSGGSNKRRRALDPLTPTALNGASLAEETTLISEDKQVGGKGGRKTS